MGSNAETNFFGYIPNRYFYQAEMEMLIIFCVLLIISLKVKSPSKEEVFIPPNRTIYKSTLFYYVVYAFYWFVVLFTLFDTNWGLDVSSRGVAQFELENRQSLLQGVATNFLLPFVLYTYHIKFFKKNVYYLSALAVYTFHSIAGGGRGGVVSMAIMLFLYFSYILKIRRKHILFFGIVVFAAMSMSATDRFDYDSILVTTLVKIVQCNSTSEFLGVVKYSVDSGIGPFPFMFLMHFVSVFFPSYILNSLGMLSYSRTTFIYNELYNPNPDFGFGFMMLADFYWCYGYIGYIFYVFTFYIVIRYYSKNIYSANPVNMVMAILCVFLFCNQRADFGTFVKPFVYTLVFLNILEYFRKKAVLKFK